MRSITDADEESSAHRAVRKIHSGKWYMGELVKNEAEHYMVTV